MGMDQMKMVFFTAHTTPLYSSVWTPRTIGQYAGTCIFLIVLSVIFRGLIAIRCNFQVLFSRLGSYHDSTLLPTEDDGKAATGRPWSVTDAALRAVLDTILAGVSYLLSVFSSHSNRDFILTFCVKDARGHDDERWVFSIRTRRYITRQSLPWRMGRAYCALTGNERDDEDKAGSQF